MTRSLELRNPQTGKLSMKRTSIGIMVALGLCVPACAVAQQVTPPPPVKTLDLTNFHRTFYDNFINGNTVAAPPGLLLGPGNLWTTKGLFSFANFGDKTTNFAFGGIDGPGLHIYEHKLDPTKVWSWRGGIIATCELPNAKQTTWKGWRQGFGYFEMEAKLPVSNGTTTTGDGVWPGLWLDSYRPDLVTTQGGTELDILEFYGAAPYDGYWETFHYTEPVTIPGVPGCHSAVATHIINPLKVDQSADFHKYGIMVEDPATLPPGTVPHVIGYFDGYEVWRQIERPEFALPKCMLVDYAVGQFLPTGVIENSHLDVHYVAAYLHN